MDMIKNKLSKGLLGSFSKTGAIDKIRQGNLAIEKELINKKYELRDKLDSLELKLDEVRKRNSKAAILAVENEIDKKKEEYRAFVKNKKAIMDKGMSLLSKAISGNQRLKDYYKAASAEDEIELSQMEYDLAKRKSSDSSELEKLKKSLEDAKKEAEEMVKRFSSSPASQNGGSSLSEKDLIDIATLNKIFNKKDGEEILDLAKSTYQNAQNKKVALKRLLSDLASEIENYKKKGLNPKKIIDNSEKKAVQLANSLDASENLVKIYKTLGRDSDSLEKKLSSQAELTRILGKINQAVLDGQDANSGTTSSIIATFGSNPTLSAGDVKNTINKIS